MAESYQRVGQAWKAHEGEILSGCCGYAILGSRPVLNPPLMIIGANPGFGEQDRQGGAHIQETWPEHYYLAGDPYRLKSRLEDLFASDLLRHVLFSATATNFLFFKSKCLNGDDPLAWSQVKQPLRGELEKLSVDELQRLTEILRPKRILVLGMGVFEQHLTDRQPELMNAKGRWLIASGQLWGRRAIGIKHPTGARWAAEDWESARDWFSENF